MATIIFARKGKEGKPLVRFIIQGDSVNEIKILVNHMGKRGKRVKEALKKASLKGRSDKRCHRNRADMLTALLGIALQAEFGQIIICKTIDGRTTLGTINGADPNNSTLPSMDWAKG